MTEIKYSEARAQIGNGDLLLFGGRAFWPSLWIRYLDNGFRWYQWRGWFSLGPWSHSEIAHWDGDHTLEAWGSVSGGPRKVPLSRLLHQYGSFGWAPMVYDGGHERSSVSAQRVMVVDRAQRYWRPGYVRYPGVRQYIRTAFRRVYALLGEPVDIDPAGYTCWEWVATLHGMPNPAAVYASDLAAWSGFGELRRVIKG